MNYALSDFYDKDLFHYTLAILYSQTLIRYPIIEIWYVLNALVKVSDAMSAAASAADTPENIPVYGKVIFPEEDRK